MGLGSLYFFVEILEGRGEGGGGVLKVAHDEQLDKGLYVWFIQQRTSGTPISGPPNDL